MYSGLTEHSNDKPISSKPHTTTSSALPRGAVRNVHFSADTSAKSSSTTDLVLTYQVKPGAFLLVCCTGLAWLCVLHRRILQHYYTSSRIASMYQTPTHPSQRCRHIHTHISPPLSYTFTHSKSIAGPCDRSFGVHVARLARFPPDIIEAADARVEALQVGDSGFCSLWLV